MSVRSRVLGSLFISFTIVALVCGILFHRAMFGGQIDADSVLETVNFVLQTVTTVGYGNWVPASWDLAKDGDARARVRDAKVVSLVLMLCGAGLFVVLIGVVANAIWAHGQHERARLEAPPKPGAR